MKNKVLIITSCQGEFREKVMAYDLPDLEIIAPETEEETRVAAETADIIFGNPFTFEKYLAGAKNLKWAQSTFAGIDALTEAGKRRDYMLTNVKDAYGEHMSEYVMMYILMIEKQATLHMRNQEKRVWKRTPFPSVQ